MTIIEYKLHISPQGMKIPDFVTDGGYWGNPDDHTLIGTVPDGVEYYVPDTVTTYTLAQLQARQRAIHAIYRMTHKWTLRLKHGWMQDDTDRHIQCAYNYSLIFCVSISENNRPETFDWIGRS